MKNQSLKSVLMGAVVVLASVQASAQPDGLISDAMAERAHSAAREIPRTTDWEAPRAPSYVTFRGLDSGAGVFGNQVRAVRRNENQVVIQLDSGEEVRVNYFFSLSAQKFAQQVAAGKSFDLSQCAKMEYRSSDASRGQVHVVFNYSTCDRNDPVEEISGLDAARLVLSSPQVEAVISLGEYRETKRISSIERRF